MERARAGRGAEALASVSDGSGDELKWGGMGSGTREFGGAMENQRSLQ